MPGVDDGHVHAGHGRHARLSRGRGAEPQAGRRAPLRRRGRRRAAGPLGPADPHSGRRRTRRTSARASSGTRGSARRSGTSTPADPPQPFVLRKRINVFGHNAPFKRVARFRNNPTQRGDDWTFALSAAGEPYGRPRRLASRRRPSARGRPLEADLPRAVQGRRRSRSCRAPTTRCPAMSRGSSSPSARTTTSSSTSAVRETTVFAVQEALELRGGAGRDRRRGARDPRRRRRVGDASRPAADRARHDDGRRRGGGGRGRQGRRTSGTISLDGDLAHVFEREHRRRARKRRARDARRDGAAAARLRPRGDAVPALHARARSADVRPVDRCRRARRPRSRCA